MSLVERALKKLQESRQSVPPAVGPAAAEVSPRTIDLELQKASVHEFSAAPAVVQLSPSRAEEKATKIVQIERNKLREMDLLPPADMERQIASQYQQVKRPLIASALGRGGAAIPNGNIIMLASALPGEGKTFTSVNLALSMALEKDLEVLLVDADVAKPHISRIFGLDNDRGLLDLLVDSNVHPDSLILRTSVDRLSILPAGKRIETATEVLASPRMEELVLQLVSDGKQRIVLFDSPPLLLSTESRALVANMGQIVLVVRADETVQKAVTDAIEAIGEAKPISLILNQTHTPPSSGYYGYGTYGDPAEPTGR
ncbi:MAG TPA: AAA family ATPase [Steroidobacteraceae bacterium]|nr:AAA family ATPase [Steroidobacteraceae bacterium]